MRMAMPIVFSPFNLPVTSDPIEGFAGPLAGILAGLLWTKKNAPRGSNICCQSPVIRHFSH